MFTGIVSARGRVVGIRSGRLGIAAPGITERLSVGGSIAVNGVCLTVIENAGSVFLADTVPETLRRTNLGLLEAGVEVNLELPIRLDQGLDGHLVQGHVDGTGTVVEIHEAELGRELRIVLPPELAAYVAEKGSIAVDGTSLTVAGVGDGAFSVAIIPHTLTSTIVNMYREGTVVNLEVDMVARYVERLLAAGRT
jgi:riboflavin synthase